MAILTDEQREELLEIASVNDGNCDRCGRVINIYKYRINEGMANTLRKLAKVANNRKENKVNFDDIAGAYSQKTQRTKMRLHGLIAKYKENGVHVASTWLITKKGWDFLAGKDIPAVVIVFDNQVIGHEGGTTNIKSLVKESIIEREPISTNEAKVYHDVRPPQKSMKVPAQYKGHALTLEDYKLGVGYVLEIEKLEVGKPVKIIAPLMRVYSDIAAFQKVWKILKEGEI
jgi:hypothetical protein